MSSFYGNGGGGGYSENEIKGIVSEYIEENTETITPIQKIKIWIGYNNDNTENSYTYDSSYNELIDLLGNATEVSCVLRIAECTPGATPTKNNEVSSITAVGYVSKSVRGIPDTNGRLTIGANIGEYVYDSTEDKWTYIITHHEFVLNSANMMTTHYTYVETFDNSDSGSSSPSIGTANIVGNGYGENVPIIELNNLTTFAEFLETFDQWRFVCDRAAINIDDQIGGKESFVGTHGFCVWGNGNSDYAEFVMWHEEHFGSNSLERPVLTSQLVSFYRIYHEGEWGVWRRYEAS